MEQVHIFSAARNSFVAAILILILGIASFFAFEPSVGRALAPEEFRVTQEITEEISFLLAPADVSMNGQIAGLSGGYATGTTRITVRTNDPQGYNMTLYFSSTTAMKLNSASSTIANYTPSTPGTPDFTWVDNTAGQSAEFGYTVMGSTTGEVDSSFMNNGSTLCGTGSTETEDRCWLNPSTTPERIIFTSGASVSSTSTIKFKVAVPSSPSPSLPSGFYVATGTLTATNN
jgi:hypothetical protein